MNWALSTVPLKCSCGHTSLPLADAWAWECAGPACGKCFVLRDGRWQESHLALLLGAVVGRVATLCEYLSLGGGLSSEHEAHVSMLGWLLAATDVARRNGVRGIFTWESEL